MRMRIHLEQVELISSRNVLYSVADGSHCRLWSNRGDMWGVAACRVNSTVIVYGVLYRMRGEQKMGVILGNLLYRSCETAVNR